MTTRGRNLLVLFAVALLAGLGLFLFRPSLHARAPADAVPDGAFLLATIDLERVRASPIASDIAALRDVSEISDMCGFDPLARVSSVAIGIPEKPDGVFGVALATHDLPEDELTQCAQRVMSARSALARVVRRGSWIEIEQQGVIAEATRAKIAYRSGSPLLVARGDYLQVMQAALDGETGRADTCEAHARLRKAALERSKGEAFLVVTAVLPKSVRERIKEELEPGKATMAAVLAVSAAALSATVHGDDIDLFAELSCETEEACNELRDLAERKTKGLPLALRIEAHGKVLDATLATSEVQLVRAIRQWWSPPARPTADGQP